MIPNPPYSPHPLLPMPPMPDDVVKTIRKHVDDRLTFMNTFLMFVKSAVKCFHW